MPRGPVLTVVITSVNEGLDKGLKEAEGKLGKLGKIGGKAAKVAKVAAPLVGITAGAAKLAGAAGKAQQASASWALAMQQVGASAADLDGPLKEAVAGSKALAFSSGDTRSALQSLQTATRDTQKSIDLLGVAQDVARLSGADLATAGDAVAKAYAGQDRALRALIPGLAATESGYETIAEAQKVAAGQAEQFGTSTEASAIRAKAELKSLAISVGKVVAPAFKALVDIVTPLIRAFGVLVDALLPVLLPLVQAVAKAFEIAAKAIEKTVNWVAKLITKVRELLAPLDKVTQKLKELNPFKGQLNTMIHSTAATVGTLSAAPMAAQGGGGGGVQINIYGDPATIEARVIRALRGYQARNGVGSVITPGRM